MSVRMKHLNARRWKNVLDPKLVTMMGVVDDSSSSSNKEILNQTDHGPSINIISDQSWAANEENDEQIHSDSSDEDVSNHDTYYEVEYVSQESQNNLVTSGRRIINIHYFLKQLKNISHTGFGCSFWNVSLVSEKIQGLESIFTFKCDVCGISETIRSDNIQKENTSGTNLAAVFGSVAIGIGYTQLRELLAALDIPGMSNNTYNKCHSIVATSKC